MKKLVLIPALVIFLLSPTTATAASICGSNSRAVQCQSNKGGTGNGFFNPEMNPRFNPEVNPRFNPMADPRFNPGAKPCDMGIGRNCKKR